jgi:uncharacterized membrane protein YhhN
MNYAWLAIAAVITVMEWIAVEREIRHLEYFAKPGAVLALIIWLWQASGFQGAIVWFGLGLLFSLAGDVFLLLPGNQLIPGLVSFLLAHIAYITGFNTSPPPVNLPAIIILLAVFLAALPIYRGVAAGLRAAGQTSLITPIFSYSIVISLMLFSALLTFVRPEWQPAPALMAGIGALSFFISDSLLAWSLFVARFSHDRLTVMMTYHIGQALIVMGSAFHFLK